MRTLSAPRLAATLALTCATALAGAGAAHADTAWSSTTTSAPTMYTYGYSYTGGTVNPPAGTLGTISSVTVSADYNTTAYVPGYFEAQVCNPSGICSNWFTGGYGTTDVFNGQSANQSFYVKYRFSHAWLNGKSITNGPVKGTTAWVSVS